MDPDSQPILNLTRGTVVCEHAVVADRPLRRMRGLLGRHSLPTGEGLLLRPAPSVHTAFMRFPIDVVFLDRDLRVVKLVESLGAWRTASARHARATLELAAGEAAARGIQIGDTLRLASAGFPRTFLGTDDPSASSPGSDTPTGNAGREELLDKNRRRPND